MGRAAAQRCFSAPDMGPVRWSSRPGTAREGTSTTACSRSLLGGDGGRRGGGGGEAGEAGGGQHTACRCLRRGHGNSLGTGGVGDARKGCQGRTGDCPQDHRARLDANRRGPGGPARHTARRAPTGPLTASAERTRGRTRRAGPGSPTGRSGARRPTRSRGVGGGGREGGRAYAAGALTPPGAAVRRAAGAAPRGHSPRPLRTRTRPWEHGSERASVRRGSQRFRLAAVIILGQSELAPGGPSRLPHQTLDAPCPRLRHGLSA